MKTMLMNDKLRSCISFFILVLVTTLPFAITGCTREPDVQKIAANNLSALNKISSYTIDEDILISRDWIGPPKDTGPNTGKSITQWRSTKYVNLSRKEMSRTSEGDRGFGEEITEHWSSETYVIGGRVYNKTVSNKVYRSNPWDKGKITDDFWETESKNSLQTVLLSSAIEVSYLGNEKIDNIDCYILRYIPEKETIVDWLGRYGLGSEQIRGNMVPLIGRGGLIRGYKESFVTNWIAKDSLLPKKSEISVHFQDRDEWWDITLNLKGQLKFYDYNKVKPIDLPAEALGGIESQIKPFKP